MNTSFIRFTTEDQLILQGLIYRPESKTKVAYLHIHGMAGNFYENKFLDAMALEITNAGYAFVAVNTRGHDIIADFPIAGSDEKFKRIGDAYEKFEESVLDIKAAVDYLQAQNFENVILCGHSLGAVKVVNYMAKTQDGRISKMVLMSPPDMVGLAEQETYHQDLLHQAQEMIKTGKGQELLPLKIWDWYMLSAETYVSLNSRDYAVDIFNTYDKSKPSLLKDIKVPVLAFFGQKDDAVIMPHQEALDIIKAKAINCPKFDTAIIPNASHGYFGEEVAMAQKITEWLKE
jgi:alpha-beta hydrolase superfamily lysophospholipase